MAQDFLQLSETYQKLYQGGKIKRLTILQAIIGLMDEQYNVIWNGEKAVEILAQQNIAVSLSSYFRHVRFVKTLVEYFQKTDFERNEILNRLQLTLNKDQESRTLYVAIQSFAVDDISSWAQIQERLNPPAELTAEKKEEEPPTGKKGKRWFSLEPLEPESEPVKPQAPEPETKMDAGGQVSSPLTVEMNDAIDKLKTLFPKLIEEQKEKESLIQDVRQKEDLIAGLTAEKENLEALLQESRQRTAELENELNQLKAETPDNLTRELKEVLIIGKSLVGKLKRVVAQKDIKEPLPIKLNGSRAEFPNYSRFYRRNFVYNAKAMAYIEDLGKKGTNRIARSIQLLGEQGNRYNSLASSRIEGGVFDGLNQIRAGKYRILWEEKPDRILIKAVFRKGESMDNIKV